MFMNRSKPNELSYRCFASFLLVMLIVGSGVGCARPCDEFADLACNTTGEKSKECAKARDYAERAPGAEQKICAQALKLASALRRK